MHGLHCYTYCWLLKVVEIEFGSSLNCAVVGISMGWYVTKFHCERGMLLIQLAGNYNHHVA